MCSIDIDINIGEMIHVNKIQPTRKEEEAERPYVPRSLAIGMLEYNDFSLVQRVINEKQGGSMKSGVLYSLGKGVKLMSVYAHWKQGFSLYAMIKMDNGRHRLHLLNVGLFSTPPSYPIPRKKIIHNFNAYNNGVVMVRRRLEEQGR